MGNVCLSLYVGVHRVSGIDKLLNFRKLVLYLCGFRLIKVMGITSDGVWNVTQEVQYAPTATTICHTSIGWWVPPTEDDAYHQWLE